MRWALARRDGTATRSVRHAARTALNGALDILHPLLTLARGTGRLLSGVRGWWLRTPKERRGPALFVTASCLLVVGLMPYGPALALAGLLATAAWYGREQAVHGGATGPDEEQLARLQAVYEALVPCFASPADAAEDPLYALEGDFERVFENYTFCDEGRLSRLRLHYPAHFEDSDPHQRFRVEQLLSAKCGRGREYRFNWDEEHNRLEMTALAPLHTGIAAQRFVTGTGEVVLGFTDASDVRRTVPVTVGGDEEPHDVPPVVWRTGGKSREPHLLALGLPGSGTTTLLRSIALQALTAGGEIVVVDGEGSGEFASLTGRRGVLGVEASLSGAVATLEWAVHETERRLLAASRAREQGRPRPADATRPLWLLLDRPAVLSHLADAQNRRDPQELLQVPLRHGRAAGVTVAVAEQLDAADELGQAVRSHTRARTVLGPVSREQAREVLGEAPPSTPGPGTPAGRGLARLGSGPVLRLQVPATPDPYDDAAAARERDAVLALLPERAAHPGPVPQAG
ncbi:ABC transporter ATP-binding protein [Streptomyces sulphureus]|uniref:ATP-binding cassette domain-containing protein n=1 Tax=Streptomyces sulphureus TaxID=47758 RepID=UPI00035C3D74|nr:ABC transporter ATP-binding protein [Streptomyces sulphureus]